MHRSTLDRNRFAPLTAALSPRSGLLQRASRVAVHADAPDNALGADDVRAPTYPMAPEVIDMDSELGYWRSRYRGLPGGSALRYGDYEPAVKLGMDAYMRSRGRSIDEMEDELEICYRRTRGISRLDWQQARAVVRLAWNHLHLRCDIKE